jgi:hypothetical protein
MMCAAALFGAGWTGQLVDANCKDAKPREACPVSAATTRFGLVRDGVGSKYFRLADSGNERVAAALAGRQKKTGKVPEGNLKVWFTGKPDGDKLALNEFELK